MQVIAPAGEPSGEGEHERRQNDILETEEEHMDWLESNLDLLGKIGLQTFMQFQNKPAEPS